MGKTQRADRALQLFSHIIERHANKQNRKNAIGEEAGKQQAPNFATQNKQRNVGECKQGIRCYKCEYIHSNYDSNNIPGHRWRTALPRFERVLLPWVIVAARRHCQPRVPCENVLLVLYKKNSISTEFGETQNSKSVYIQKYSFYIVKKYNTSTTKKLLVFSLTFGTGSVVSLWYYYTPLPSYNTTWYHHFELLRGVRYRYKPKKNQTPNIL